jgi:hypothetical protein
MPVDIPANDNHKIVLPQAPLSRAEFIMNAEKTIYAANESQNTPILRSSNLNSSVQSLLIGKHNAVLWGEKKRSFLESQQPAAATTAPC